MKTNTAPTIGSYLDDSIARLREQKAQHEREVAALNARIEARMEFAEEIRDVLKQGGFAVSEVVRPKPSAKSLANLRPGGKPRTPAPTAAKGGQPNPN